MSNPENENQKLNPQIQKLEIGVRTLRSITIYPLAMGDQLKLSDIVTEALQKFFLQKDQADIAFVGYMLEMVREKLDIVIELVVDEVDRSDGSLLDELTNTQAIEFAEIIYKINYEALTKKVLGLLKTNQMESLQHLGRSFQESAENTDTDSPISTESPGEMEESPLDS